MKKNTNIYYFEEEPDFVEELVFEQETPEDSGKYQCDCDYVAVTKNGKKVVKFGNVAANKCWGYIEE